MGSSTTGRKNPMTAGTLRPVALAVLNDAANAEPVLQHAESLDERIGQRDEVATAQVLEHQQPERDSQREHEHAQQPAARDPREITRPDEMAARSSMSSFTEC